MRKSSQAELLPAAQARARASSSTRSVSRKVRASAWVAPAGTYFAATSQRIAAKDSRARPIFSQPLLTCSSAARPVTADCTKAGIGFVARMIEDESTTGLVLDATNSLDACKVNVVRKASPPFRSSGELR